MQLRPIVWDARLMGSRTRPGPADDAHRAEISLLLLAMFFPSSLTFFRIPAWQKLIPNSRDMTYWQTEPDYFSHRYTAANQSWRSLIAIWPDVLAGPFSRFLNFEIHRAKDRLRFGTTVGVRFKNWDKHQKEKELFDSLSFEGVLWWRTLAGWSLLMYSSIREDRNSKALENNRRDTCILGLSDTLT